MNKLIIANWKMNLSNIETIKLCKQLTEIDINSGQLVLCPSALYLNDVRGIINTHKIHLGAQDCASRDIAAFTGGISARQLSEAGCKYVIVGHSERRTYVHETAQEIHDKIVHLLNHNITPILCVGEDSISHKADKTTDVISMQLDEIGFNIDWSKVVVAYEPIWAVGTGQTPTVEEITSVINLIKIRVNSRSVLYGGSVNKSNIKELAAIVNIGGFLIGSASTNFDEIKEILAGV